MNNRNKIFKFTVVSISWLWFLFFSLFPLVLILLVSFFKNVPGEIFSFQFSLGNYRELLNILYFKIFLRSFMLAAFCTLVCLIIAYPFAYILSKINKRWRHFLLLLVIIPFWTSSLVRTYAIMAILKTKGLLNSLLLGLGIISHPLQLLYSNFAVIFGCVYDLLPYMILPLFISLNNLDCNLLEAARDLGAKKVTIFFKIILPLTKPGILSGSLLVFLPAMTMFYIPVLLGGAKNFLLGNLIEYQFLTANNWPLGGTISSLLTLIMFMIIFLYWLVTRSHKGDK